MKKTTILIVALLIVAATASGLFAETKYWIINLRGGAAVPMDTFGKHNDIGYDVGFSVRQGLDMEFSWGGGLDMASMSYKDKAAPQAFTASTLDLEAVYSPYWPDIFIWPYLKAGVAFCMLKYTMLASVDNPVPKSENTFGFLIGGGINIPIGGIFTINVETLYHHISLNGGVGDMNSYLGIGGGLTLFLK